MAKTKKLRVNTLNEQVILATILKDSEQRNRVIRDIEVEDFVAPRHKILFEVFTKLNDSSFKYDEDTILQLAGDDDFGGIEYLNEIADAYQSNPNLDYHIRVLKLDKLKYDLFVGSGGELYDSLMSREIDNQDIIQLANEIISISRNALPSERIVSGKQAASDYIEDFEQRTIRNFIGSGFQELDEILIDGFAPGQVSVIASRPGIGKSQLTANFMVNWAREGYQMLICEIEMGNINFMDLLISNMTGVCLDDLIKTPEKLTERQLTSIRRKVDYISGNANFNFLGKPDLTLKELESEMRSGDYDICVVDLFTRLVDVEDDPRVLTEKLQQVKRIALTTGTHICLVHQIKRTDPKKKNKRPSYDQLKGSGAWEECADLILLLHREGYYDKSLTKQIMEIDIAKQKRGLSREVVPYSFRGEIVELGEFQENFIIGKDLGEF